MLSPFFSVNYLKGIKSHDCPYIPIFSSMFPKMSIVLYNQVIIKIKNLVLILVLTLVFSIEFSIDSHLTYTLYSYI